MFSCKLYNVSGCDAYRYAALIDAKEGGVTF